jgi:uncharacterized membrane protein
MALWIGIGAAVGAILGALSSGIVGALLLALIGAGLGALVARSAARSPAGGAGAQTAPPAAQYGEREQAAQASEGASSPAHRVEASLGAELLRRLDAIEARLAGIEARLDGSADVQTQPAAPRFDRVDVAVPSAVAIEAGAPASTSEAAHVGLERAPDGTLQAAAVADGANVVAAAPVAATADVDAPPPRPAYGGRGPSLPATPSVLWRWLTGGNAVTRIGIVILFFGVAFLLTYFAEIVTVPIEWKLAGAGAGGIALAVLGVVLARRRPAYGLSLQGAGMGVVYLVVFAAFRLYDVLGPVAAIALLVLTAGTTVALALRHDSQPLAALALAGGFLAPVLIRTGTIDPAPLFGYFAILNAAIFAIAWRRAWRPLNVLGFAFTFALALLWGHRFYTPAHYATVQPFLALFFLFYVGIAVLYARRDVVDARSPVDGVLVFGVPIAGFALQMAIVRGHRYGVAISAGLLAAFYATLWWLFRRRAEAGLALLARAFAVLAISFATLAIPFAADPRATSAWWAIEAAAVYWIGAVQKQRLARAFAIVLQVAAAVAFALEIELPAARPFANANFLGAALIGIAALATTWTADRHADALGPRERALVPWLFAWGVAWWTFGGIDELRRHVAAAAQANAALAWVGLTTAVALGVARYAAWPRALWCGALLLPAMLLAALHDLEAARTTLSGLGWLVWPLAWSLQWTLLRAVDAERDRSASAAQTGVRRDAVELAHTVSAIALVAWCSWEASEWIGRHTREGSVWIACAAALPGIAYLAVVLRERDRGRWPFDRHAEAYGASAGTTVAALVVAWFAAVNVLSPGDAAPLPYVPLANPLDLTLCAALLAVARWSRAFSSATERARLAALGIAAFVALNGTVVRAAHHWGDVPWRLADLAAYRPLQAALTLTWTATALALMLWSTRTSLRVAWMVGAALLAAVVVKLFALDLAALSGLTRVIAFMGVGALLLVIGYVAPLPPASTVTPAD